MVFIYAGSKGDGGEKRELEACLLKLVFRLNLIKFMKARQLFPRSFQDKIDSNEMWT